MEVKSRRVNADNDEGRQELEELSGLEGSGPLLRGASSSEAAAKRRRLEEEASVVHEEAVLGEERPLALVFEENPKLREMP